MEDNKKKKQTNLDDEITIPDFAELWKEIYFQAEESWGTIVKDITTTTSYMNAVNQMRNQSLKSYELTTQNIDKLMENNPFASKKEIANLAELVIGVEDKFDTFDYQISEHIKSITKSLIKLLDYQIQWKDDLDWIKDKISGIDSEKEVLELKEHINSLNCRDDLQFIKQLLEKTKTEISEEITPLKSQIEKLTINEDMKTINEKMSQLPDTANFEQIKSQIDNISFTEEINQLKLHMEKTSSEGEIRQILQMLSALPLKDEINNINTIMQSVVTKEEFDKLLMQVNNLPSDEINNINTVMQNVVTKEEFDKLLMQVNSLPSKEIVNTLLEGIKSLQKSVEQINDTVIQLKEDTATHSKRKKTSIELDANAPVRKNKSIKRNDKA